MNFKLAGLVACIAVFLAGIALLSVFANRSKTMLIISIVMMGLSLAGAIVFVVLIKRDTALLADYILKTVKRNPPPYDDHAMELCDTLFEAEADKGITEDYFRMKKDRLAVDPYSIRNLCLNHASVKSTKSKKKR